MILLHIIVIQNLLMLNCNTQLFHALLLSLALTCTISYVNFSSTILINNFCIYYWTDYNQWINAAFDFKCTMGIDSFFMRYCNWQLFYALLQLNCSLDVSPTHLTRLRLTMLEIRPYVDVWSFLSRVDYSLDAEAILRFWTGPSFDIGPYLLTIRLPSVLTVHFTSELTVFAC